MPLAPQQIRTFFVTSNTQGRRNILQSAPMAQLFMAVLADNRTKARFLLHEFVLMPDHFHLLITPAESVPLEAVQYLKGGFSFRAKKELGFVEKSGKGASQTIASRMPTITIDIVITSTETRLGDSWPKGPTSIFTRPPTRKWKPIRRHHG